MSEDSPQFLLIKNRILNEHRKYAHKEQFFEPELWAEMAARKIIASLPYANTKEKL